MRLPKTFRTSTFRLTAAYAGLFAVSAIVLFGFIYFTTSASMTKELDYAVKSDQLELLQIHASHGTDAMQSEINQRVREDVELDGPIFYLLEDVTGKRLAGNLPAAPLKTGTFRLEGRQTPATLVGHTAYARGVILPDGNYLLVAADASSMRQTKKIILKAFSWSFIITLLFFFIGGVFVSRRVLKKIEIVSQTTLDIVDGNLSRRIQIRGVNDEFDHLGASLNLMLDQIENLMEGMQQVSNDIAHDLRTPLTRLRQKLELAQGEGSANALHAAIRDSIAETDGILETFGALLRITQIETRARKKNFSQVYLSELLQTVVEVYQSNADEKLQDLTIDIEPKLHVLGDRELLAQMLSNLIENSIRHSPVGASIEVIARKTTDAVEVIFSDTGPGIPESERNNVFRRFFRLETSRSTQGNGLGLSLVAAVAELHGVKIILSDNSPGLRVGLQFPKSDFEIVSTVAQDTSKPDLLRI